MKKLFCLILAMLLIISALALTGCDDDKKDNNKTKSTEETEAKVKGEIQTYLDSFTEGNSDLYGVWQMKGSTFMSIIFRNDELAELVTGTEGYFSKYSVDENAKTLTVQLMPNFIDGTYNYKFSKNNNKLTLSLNGSKLEFVKAENSTLVPDAPKNPEIDKNILGWWESEDGIFYCFQDDGIMYENSISMETCYTYSAEKGKIKAVYSSGGELEEEFTYSVKGKKLILNDTEYSKKKTP